MSGHSVMRWVGAVTGFTGQAGKSQRQGPSALRAQIVRPSPVPSGQILASAVAPRPSHALGGQSLTGEGDAASAVPASTAPADPPVAPTPPVAPAEPAPVPVP